MAALKNLKPVHLYLIAVACFFLSRVVYDRTTPVFHYSFSLIGFVFLVLAIRKYLKTKK
ncbi:hypothetical protein FLLO111716_06405 [Flavobacterium longum]|uniref:hypothetical protein n=1 Tax=Flavobacterium longum TaxID=1299340 RepID=UPI0039E7B5D2